MTPRITALKVAPDAYRAMSGIEAYAWNRIAIGLRAVPGSYKPAGH